MPNPRHPSRLIDYNQSDSDNYYPRELLHNNGELIFINEEGEAINLYSQRLSVIESDIADLKYVPISISSFSHGKGTMERGQVVDSVTLTWATNKTPTKLTLDGAEIDKTLKTKTITGLSIKWDANKTWTLVATDERGATSSKSASITFYNGVYYGVATAPSSYNSSFILTLTKNLRSSKLPSFTVNAGSGQYIYYCLPTRLGTCTFTVGGFTGGFSLIDTISFTNSFGYAENYYIYKSDSANLGSTTVNVS